MNGVRRKCQKFAIVQQNATFLPMGYTVRYVGKVTNSVTDPVPFLPLYPGSGIVFFPDLGSWIPTPYF